jgi:ATP synthase mitochondrial F1 complex assembly factor 1
MFASSRLVKIPTTSWRNIKLNWTRKLKSRLLHFGHEYDADWYDREGHKSIDSLKEAYEDKISDLRRMAASIPSGSTSQPKSVLQQSPPPAPKPQSTGASTGASPSAPGIKPLSAYLDLSKVASLPNKELEYIWRLRHASDPLSLCAVIPIETYNRIYRAAKNHPQFILPLPRPAADDGSGEAEQAAQGFEGGQRTAADIHFLQWGFHPPAVPPAPGSSTAHTHTSTVLFTHLASFKVHGAYAQPHTTITHHLDLADSHGLVLLNGAVVGGRGVSAEEGRWLVMCLQKFYDFEGHGGGIGKEKRQGLLEKFSKGDHDFKLEDLVDEAERVS